MSVDYAIEGLDMSGTAIDGTAPWCDAGTGESESEFGGQTCEEIRTALEGLVQGIVVISNFKCDISDTCGTLVRINVMMLHNK